MSHAVSVVIPTHARAEVLPRAITSALEQGSAVHDVLVVDDEGSADTRAVVDGLSGSDVPVRYVDASGRAVTGPSASRNVGAAQATSEVLAFLDDDDQWLPGYLDRALAAMDTSRAGGSAPPCCVVTWTRRSRGDERMLGSRLDPSIDHRDPEHRYWSFGVTGSNLVVRAATFAEIGGYDEDLWSREDQEIFVRLLGDGRDYAVVPEELVDQDAGGGPHLAAKSGRAAGAVQVYLAKHGAQMTRRQRRGAQRYYHSMLCGADTARIHQLRHRALQAWYSSAADWRMMTLGRLTGDRSPGYR